MTQNTEQKVRTRDEQIVDLGSRIFVGMRNHTDSMVEAQRHIDEAAARGTKALEDQIASLTAQLKKLENAASRVARYGATPGPQWVELTTALLSARGALAKMEETTGG